jgi:hypothetical protein
MAFACPAGLDSHGNQALTKSTNAHSATIQAGRNRSMT